MMDSRPRLNAASQLGAALLLLLGIDEAQLLASLLELNGRLR